jgi:polar amino acid transport system substrate-binding protein
MGILTHAWAQSHSASGAQGALSTPSSNTEKPSHALFVTDEWHNLTRKDGTGLYLDIIKAVFARQGIEAHFRTYPYARAVQQVKDKRADGWVASFLKEKAFPLYPQYHFDKNEQTIVYLKRKQSAPVSTGSLKNQRVAWLRDFGLDRFIAEPMRITELDSIESAFQMLENDRIDYFIGAKSDIEDYIRNGRQNMREFGMAYAMHLGLYVAFADTPRGVQLRELWDAEMAKFHTTDAFKAIYKKYGYRYPFP